MRGLNNAPTLSELWSQSGASVLPNRKHHGFIGVVASRRLSLNTGTGVEGEEVEESFRGQIKTFEKSKAGTICQFSLTAVAVSRGVRKSLGPWASNQAGQGFESHIQKALPGP